MKWKPKKPERPQKKKFKIFAFITAAGTIFLAAKIFPSTHFKVISKPAVNIQCTMPAPKPRFTQKLNFNALLKNLKYCVIVPTRHGESYAGLGSTNMTPTEHRSDFRTYSDEVLPYSVQGLTTREFIPIIQSKLQNRSGFTIVEKPQNQPFQFFQPVFAILDHKMEIIRKLVYSTEYICLMGYDDESDPTVIISPELRALRQKVDKISMTYDEFKRSKVTEFQSQPAHVFLNRLNTQLDNSLQDVLPIHFDVMFAVYTKQRTPMLQFLDCSVDGLLEIITNNKGPENIIHSVLFEPNVHHYRLSEDFVSRVLGLYHLNIPMGGSAFYRSPFNPCNLQDQYDSFEDLFQKMYLCQNACRLVNEFVLANPTLFQNQQGMNFPDPVDPDIFIPGMAVNNSLLRSPDQTASLAAAAAVETGTTPQSRLARVEEGRGRRASSRRLLGSPTRLALMGPAAAGGEVPVEGEVPAETTAANAANPRTKRGQKRWSEALEHDGAKTTKRKR